MQKRIPTLTGFMIIAIEIIVLFSGVFIYQYFAQKGLEQTVEMQKLIGGDKDSHGCLIAAGYSWCEVKNKCLRTWEEKCEKTADQTASWKTYADQEKGFSIQYPPTWKVQKFSCNIDGVEFCPAETQPSSLGVCGMRCSDSDKGYVSIVTEGKVTVSSLMLWDQKYKEIYNLMVSTFKLTK